METNSLIGDSQHGFRRGRSCETNLLALMEYHAQRAEEGNNEDDYYFDLKAFFDGIPHQRCLAAFNTHGVPQEGKIHKWITAWLGTGGELLEQGARGRSQAKEQGATAQNLGGGAGSKDSEDTAKERSNELGEENRKKEPQVVRRRQRVVLNGKASKWHQVTASII